MDTGPAHNGRNLDYQTEGGLSRRDRRIARVSCGLTETRNVFGAAAIGAIAEFVVQSAVHLSLQPDTELATHVATGAITGSLIYVVTAATKAITHRNIARATEEHARRMHEILDTGTPPANSEQLLIPQHLDLRAPEAQQNLEY